MIWSSLFEQKYLGGQILYRSVDPPIKNGVYLEIKTFGCNTLKQIIFFF